MRRSVVAGLLLSLLPVITSAQTDSAATPTSTPSAAPLLEQRSWGLGVSLTALGGAEDLPVAIRIPLRLGARWRLEPEVGLYRSTMKYSLYTNDPSAPTSPTHDDGPQLRRISLAVALTRVEVIDHTVRFYFGPRIGIARQTWIYDLDGSAGSATLRFSLTDHTIGWLSGAEAAIGSRLTLGGEIGVTFVKHGEANVEQPAYSQVSIVDGGSEFTTSGAVVMRWFRGRLVAPARTY